MDLVYYYLLIIFIVSFIHYIYSLKNSQRRRNTVVVPINIFDTDEMDTVINTYDLISQENIICPITQENIGIGENVKELPCGHKFSNSIYKWIRTKNECPVCRKNILNII